MNPKLRLYAASSSAFVVFFLLYGVAVFASSGFLTEKLPASPQPFLVPSTIVSDNFSGSTPTYANPYQSPAFSVSTGLSANGIAKGAGVTAVSTPGSYSSFSWNQGTLAAAQTDNDYYEWVITPQLGKEIDFTQFALVVTRGNNGNSPKDFVLLASTNNFTSSVNLGAINVGNAAATTLTYNNVTAFGTVQNVQTAITFRLYGYTGGTNSNGTFNVLSYEVTGEVFDLPTFSSVSQEAVVCESAPTATIVLTGLLPNSVSTIGYTIAGGAIQTATGVVADGSGVASFPLVLTVANDSQILTITSILRTDLIGVSPFTPTLGNTVALEIDPLLTWYLDADNDGYSVGESITACYTPGVGYTTTVVGAGDCNDANPAVNPGAAEVCYDSIDNDCDGSLYNGCTLFTVNITPSFNNITLPDITTTITSSAFAPGSGNTAGYRFRITNVATETFEEINRTAANIKISQSTLAAYATTYTVEVAAIVNGEVQPYLGNTVTVTTPEVPVLTQTTQIWSSLCNSTLASIETPIYSTSVNGATAFRFKIVRADDITETPYYFETSTASFFRLPLVPDLPFDFETSYLVSVQFQKNLYGSLVWSDFGAVCTVTTPAMATTQIWSSLCNAVLGSIDTPIYSGSVWGANTFRFKVVRMDDVSQTPYYFETSTASFFRLPLVPGLAFDFGKTYQVSVQYRRAYYGVQFWSNYGTVCTVTTPAMATTQIWSSLCNATLNSINTSIYSGSVYGANTFRFKVIKADDPTQTPEYVEVSGASYFRLTDLVATPVVAGATYLVSVQYRKLFYGEQFWSGFGTVCSVTTPGGDLKNVVTQSTDDAVTFTKSNASIKAYPNPFTSTFTLELPNVSDASSVSLAVYDSTGRLIESKTIASGWESVTIGEGYATGVYHLVVTQHGEQQLIRMVKQ